MERKRRRNGRNKLVSFGTSIMLISCTEQIENQCRNGLLFPLNILYLFPNLFVKTLRWQ